ncbi:hypothetical protein [Saccharothrix algeriensis]|uniref:Uncharacterized protein n=1 Tax=Saccharothrix algeriensis TaxID=173560 RepID=A0A8T8HZ87_9PSEU|nr:hypothetical protein [Saccharothrix algeriensis]MBM7809354.1 hypothetical protein [Saccharothrix algeriensis]QTR03699.1 hypothetical protein J7S33_01185 [Saccharothrix algeriensis]
MRKIEGKYAMGKHSMGATDRQWGGPELVVDAEAAAEAATAPRPAGDEGAREADAE